MIIHNLIYSSNEPQPIEVTNLKVLVASNIHAVTLQNDEGQPQQFYCYQLSEYDKNEYIKLIGEQNNELRSELLDTQTALCDVYEMIEGGLENG